MPVQIRRMSAFATKFLAELHPALEAKEVSGVYLDLPSPATLTWENNTSGEHDHCVPYKLRIGSLKKKSVYVYFPKNFLNAHPPPRKTGYPPMDQEDSMGVAGEEGLVWGSSEPNRRLDELEKPFCWMKHDRNNSSSKFPWYAMLGFYFLTAGFDDNGVKMDDFEKWFVEALDYIEKNEEYMQIMLARVTAQAANRTLAA